MRAVQISIDEPLLERLDADEDVRRAGRSAVMRRLIQRYLEQKRELAIDARYEAGYAGFEGLGSEFEGWDRVGVWPQE